MWNFTFEYTTTHFNVFDQTDQEILPWPSTHTSERSTVWCWYGGSQCDLWWHDCLWIIISLIILYYVPPINICTVFNKLKSTTDLIWNKYGFSIKSGYLTSTRRTWGLVWMLATWWQHCVQRSGRPSDTCYSLSLPMTARWELKGPGCSMADSLSSG